MSDEEPPVISFPCAYPIKVMATARPTLRADVLAVFAEFCGPILDSDVTSRASKQGTYLALTVTITATGKEQLAALHERLRGVAGVRLVL